MINIVIVGDRIRIPNLLKNLGVQKDITVIHSSEDVRGLEPHLRKADAIVLDIAFEIAESYVLRLKTEGVPIIAVTDSPAHGFNMVEWGASAMQVRTEGQSPQFFYKLLADKVRNVSKLQGGKKPRVLKRPDFGRVNHGDKIIVIGSSTGGTDALERILRDLPEDTPPILVVQHMPPVFTKMFAERLDNSCRVSVWEGRDGDPLMRGLVLVAPGDYHMVLSGRGGGLFIKCIGGERVCNQRPAADVLFNSVANVLGSDCKNVLGVILTGMGSDGANGLLELRQLGSYTIGQDEASSVVYGMPRAAYECGAVAKQLHLGDIAPAIMKFTRGG